MVGGAGRGRPGRGRCGVADGRASRGFGAGRERRDIGPGVTGAGAVLYRNDPPAASLAPPRAPPAGRAAGGAAPAGAARGRTAGRGGGAGGSVSIRALGVVATRTTGGRGPGGRWGAGRVRSRRLPHPLTPSGRF